nr:hypothetical protein [Tanacetum cinerariifolium]
MVDSVHFWSLVVGEREENSFLVVNLFGKAVQYNIISKTDMKNLIIRMVDSVHFWSLVVGEREENSFLVVNLFGKVVQYNIISKTDMKNLIIRMVDSVHFWSLVVGEREENSFLVVNLFGKAVQYNIISKTVSEIYDIGSNEVADDYLHCFILPFAIYDIGYEKLDHKVYEFISSSTSV